MMGRVFPFAALVFFISTKADAADCKKGWIPYKDELCIKSFDNVLPYDEAKEFCKTKGNEFAKASMIMVKDARMQRLLSIYTSHIPDNIWLGGKYDPETAQFIWDDGEPLSYKNWEDGYPRNMSNPDMCIEMQSSNSSLWTDVSCRKRNLVICQRTMPWTLHDAVEEIKRVRKELQTTKQELEAVRSTVMPMGYIYVEYSGQQSPRDLWPSLAWEDVTSTYAGLFFRASGGASGNWGETQSECVPRITETEYGWGSSLPPTGRMTLPSNGWSSFIQTGSYVSGSPPSAIRFHAERCEIRPKNQAVRLWKRTLGDNGVSIQATTEVEQPSTLVPAPQAQEAIMIQSVREPYPQPQVASVEAVGIPVMAKAHSDDRHEDFLNEELSHEMYGPFIT